MSVPKLVESIPTVNTPVVLSELRERRRQYLAGVVTGGVLIVVNVGLIVFYFAVVGP